MLLFIATAYAADVTASTTVDLTPIRDALITLAAAIISVGTPVVLAWLRAHWRLMQQASINAVVTQSASRLGADLIGELRQQGKAITTIDVGDPTVARLANRLIGAYPKFTQQVGAGPAVIGSVIIGEAKKLIETNAILPPGSPDVVMEMPDAQARQAAREAQPSRPPPTKPDRY